MEPKLLVDFGRMMLIAIQLLPIATKDLCTLLAATACGLSAIVLPEKREIHAYFRNCNPAGRRRTRMHRSDLRYASRQWAVGGSEEAGDLRSLGDRQNR
jgi:hypothetical protein